MTCVGYIAKNNSIFRPAVYGEGTQLYHTLLSTASLFCLLLLSFVVARFWYFNEFSTRVCPGLIIEFEERMHCNIQ